VAGEGRGREGGVRGGRGRGGQEETQEAVENYGLYVEEQDGSLLYRELDVPNGTLSIRVRRARTLLADFRCPVCSTILVITRSSFQSVLRGGSQCRKLGIQLLVAACPASVERWLEVTKK